MTELQVTDNGRHENRVSSHTPEKSQLSPSKSNMSKRHASKTDKDGRVSSKKVLKTPISNSNMDFMSRSDEYSLPIDELASHNAISAPDEITDSQASDYQDIKLRNERNRRLREKAALIESMTTPGNALGGDQTLTGLPGESNDKAKSLLTYRQDEH